MIVGLILIFIAFVVSVIDIVIEHEKGGMGFIILFSTLSGFICVSEGIKKYELESPQAIDVYRGNTTLQITYIDSIPVDTVVVFKNR